MKSTKPKKTNEELIRDQIIRWRARLKREGITLGKASERVKRNNAARKEIRAEKRKAREDVELIKSGKKRWF